MDNIPGGSLDYAATLPATTGLMAGHQVRLQSNNRVYTLNAATPAVWIADGPEVIFIKSASVPVTALNPQATVITWAEVPQYIYGEV